MCKKNMNPKNDEKKNRDNPENGSTVTSSLSKDMIKKDVPKLQNPYSDSQNITCSENDRQIQEMAEQNQRNAETPIYTNKEPLSKTVKITDKTIIEEEPK